MMSKNIWVLDDNRNGNTNQAIALAQNLEHDYVVKKIVYNWFKYLPSYFLSKYPIHLNEETIDSFNQTPLPDFIISAGRKTSVIALYLKNRFQKTKLLQIMRPAYYSKQFEAIIVPIHDHYHKASNVIEIIGSLNNILPRIKEDDHQFKQNYPNIDKFIGVIIGGNTKNFTMSKYNATELAQSLKGLSVRHSLPLFISFSRRTPINVKKIITQALKEHIIYDPALGGYNPYIGIVANASYIIVTSDSISMISEVASSGKALHIYCPDNFNSKKHLAFIYNLIETKTAKILDLELNSLENYNYTPLNEIARIKLKIKQLLV